MLFDLPAVGLHEEREERRADDQRAVRAVANLVAAMPMSAVAWCHLNAEGDLLTKPDPRRGASVAARTSDDAKEEKFTGVLGEQDRRACHQARDRRVAA